MRNGISVLVKNEHPSAYVNILVLRGNEPKWISEYAQYVTPSEKYHKDSWETLFRTMISENKGLAIVKPDKRGEYLFISVDESLKLLQQFL
jgi:hypothetical protein